MARVAYLNVGCGSKFHKDWFNVDVRSINPEVIVHNLNEGIPFEDNKFDVLYHSHVIEHFQKEDELFFSKECYRVLKPGGIIRVVTPDLENLAKNYLMLLEQNLNNQTEESAVNYEWILLEMFDQNVRNQSGGKMGEYLKRPGIINEKFVIDRLGLKGKNIRDRNLTNPQSINQKTKLARIARLLNPKKWLKALKVIRFKGVALLGLLVQRLFQH